MRLTIEHETHYRFDEEAHHSIQYLRLTPRSDPSQSVYAWQVSTPGKLKRWVDGFGNIVHVSVQNGTHTEVPIVVRGEVETLDTAGILSLDDGLPPQMFLRPTPYTRVNDQITEFASGFVERVRDEGTIAGLHAVAWGLHSSVSYEPGLTDVETTAAEALANGKGVCQDLAHLFIACCRVLKVPARYVSGYLLSRVENSGSLATHAWAEAYIDERVGWISFDPTHSRSATDEYVRLAIAFDYAGAAPIRGVRKGGGTEEMSVRVSITQ